MSSGQVWVTFCSLIFCDPCGTSLTSTFYQHETSQEMAFLEERIERVMGRVESVKQYYEGVIEQFKREISTLEAKLENRSNSSSNMFNSSEGEETRKMGDIQANLGVPPSLSVGNLGESSGENSWEINSPEQHQEEAGFNFAEEPSHFFHLGPGDQGGGGGGGAGGVVGGGGGSVARPYKLVRTKITEQNKWEVVNTVAG